MTLQELARETLVEKHQRMGDLRMNTIAATLAGETGGSTDPTLDALSGKE